jgi:photosystem II stability/assembly factor-like uncharacterized protein
MKLRFTAILLIALVTAPGVLAERLSGVSHRARLYDIATHGKNVFVVGHPGMLLRSTDEGQHFAVMQVPSQDALFAIDINRAGLGAIVGRRGLVLITKDGGASWTKTNALPAGGEGAEASHLFAVDVLDSGVIIAVGDFGSIVRSTDQGKTWERRSYSLGAAAAAAEPSPSEADVPEKKGRKGKKAHAAKSKKKKNKKARAEAEVAQPELEDPSTGGLPDMSGHDNSGAEEEARLTGISFGDDKHGFAVGEFGLILASDDGGLTWKQQQSATHNLLYAVQAVDAKFAVLAGSDGVVLETLDGGRKWTRVPTSTQKHLFGISATKERVIAVGGDGAVLVRAKGEPFKLVKTNVFTWFSSVLLLDDAHALVAGARGLVLGTKDGGQTFGRVVGE